MQTLLKILSFFSILCSSRIRADELPPLGKRLYLLDSKTPTRPADIRPLERGTRVPGQGVMLDPLALDASSVVDRSKSKAADTPKRISRMSFDRVSVQGRYLVPRVIFDRPALDLGRQEVPIKVEYKKKILESERELREFEW